MKKEITVKEHNFFYLRKTGQILLVTPVIFSGLVYVILQWYFTGEIDDTIFVGLLFGASVILVYGVYLLGNHMILKSPSFFLAAFEDQKKMDAANMHADFLHHIFDAKKMSISGLFYGIILSLFPVLVRVWPENWLLLASLSLFMFFVNYVTGAALYCLVRFIEKTYRITPLIQIDLWQANSGRS